MCASAAVVVSDYALCCEGSKQRIQRLGECEQKRFGSTRKKSRRKAKLDSTMNKIISFPGLLKRIFSKIFTIPRWRTHQEKDSSNRPDDAFSRRWCRPCVVISRDKRDWRDVVSFCVFVQCRKQILLPDCILPSTNILLYYLELQYLEQKHSIQFLIICNLYPYHYHDHHFRCLHLAFPLPPEPGVSIRTLIQSGGV